MKANNDILSTLRPCHRLSRFNTVASPLISKTIFVSIHLGAFDVIRCQVVSQATVQHDFLQAYSISTKMILNINVLHWSNYRFVFE